MRTVWASFWVSRLFVAVFVYWGHANHPYLQPVAGGYEGVRHWILNPWTGYDARFYVDMAQHGYTRASAPFFPLYPALLQPFAHNCVAAAAWGVLLSNGFLLLGLRALYELARDDFGEQTARAALWLTALWPTSAAFSSVYTESLFLACACGGFLALRRGHWLACAVLLFCASLTRNIGPLLGVALLCEAYRAHRSGHVAWKPTLCCALAPICGFLWVQLSLRAHFGVLGATSQSDFGRAWMAPWLPVGRELRDVFSSNANLVALLNLLAILVLPVLLWRLRGRVPASYAVLMVGAVLMNLTLAHFSPPYTNSTLRYLSTSIGWAPVLALGCAPMLRSRLSFLAMCAFLLMSCAVFSYGWGDKQHMLG